MFNGSYSDIEDKTYLRSIPAAATTGSSYNLGQMVTIAKNRTISGSEKFIWNIGYKSGWDYICDLITLVTKRDEASSYFGRGAALSSTPQTISGWSGPGFKKDTTDDGTGHVRIFWIWDFYGSTR